LLQAAQRNGANRLADQHFDDGVLETARNVRALLVGDRRQLAYLGEHGRLQAAEAEIRDHRI
jgi:hypothetical protein